MILPRYRIAASRIPGAGKGLFLYLALKRDRANLAMARHQLRRIENDLDV